MVLPSTMNASEPPVPSLANGLRMFSLEKGGIREYWTALSLEEAVQGFEETHGQSTQAGSAEEITDPETLDTMGFYLPTREVQTKAKLFARVGGSEDVSISEPQ